MVWTVLRRDRAYRTRNAGLEVPGKRRRGRPKRKFIMLLGRYAGDQCDSRMQETG